MKEVLFWWHFHQPLYKDLKTGTYKLPWVFLHLIKDYHFFLELALEFPEVKQNMNYSPVLLEQIRDYTVSPEEVDDPWIKAFLTPPDELDKETREFILKYFFSVNFERSIMSSPLYYELYLLKERGGEFDASHFLSLQTLFFWSWLSPLFLERDPELSSVGKKEKISQEDKDLVWNTARVIVSDFFGLLKRASESPNIEITATPYYHPILPLIINTNCVKSMNIPMPSLRFAFPDDASAQISDAVKFMEGLGIPVAGMWPSEGSIDSASVSLMAKHGIKYAGSDERILHESLQGRNRDSVLYEYDGVKIFFRDRKLSDDIAFKYAAMETGEAVESFKNHLYANDRPSIVIMDGENAWEYFPGNGLPFLRALYEAITHDQIRSYTLEEASANFTCGNLEEIVPGSWIDVGFPLWIGSEAKNNSWDTLNIVRSTLDPSELSDTARASLFAAEGSDWNWWYDTYYGSEAGMDFDGLYRLHLRNVALAAGLSLNGRLEDPIRKSGESVFYRLPVKLISPFINGREDNYYEWVFAGFIDTRNTSGTMKQVDQRVSKIYFGYDLYNLFLRIDVKRSDFDTLSVNILKGDKRTIDFNTKTSSATMNGRDLEDKVEIGVGEIIEIRIPFYLIGIEKDEDFNLNFILKEAGNVLEMHPTFSHIPLRSPGEDFQLKNWRV